MVEVCKRFTLRYKLRDLLLGLLGNACAGARSVSPRTFLDSVLQLYTCNVTYFSISMMCVRAEGRKVLQAVGSPFVTCLASDLVGRHQPPHVAKASAWSLCTHALLFQHTMLARRILRPCATSQLGTRALHSTFPSLAVLGLRAEDPARRWERRAALDPDAVRQLVQDGHNVLVEQCSKRAIREEEYKEVSRPFLIRIA